MARLTREDVFQLATKLGWKKGEPLNDAQRTAIRNALRGALSAADTAPTRVFDGTGNFRPMTLDEATENLLEELV